MEIMFRVRNVEVPENLRRVTLEKVRRLAGQCGIDRVEVSVSEERNPRIAEREVCEITLFASGRIVRAHAAATEVSVAVDRVVGKLEQRADRFRGRRSKGRRSKGWRSKDWRSKDWRSKGWRHPAECIRTMSVTGIGDGSVHFPAGWSAARAEPGAVDCVVDYVVGDAGKAADMGITDSTAEPMTPEEAALEMGEQGNEIFFFMNAETGWPAAVYHRNNGDIALFDAASAAPRPMI
jgi:ribosomal subunit interface protein